MLKFIGGIFSSGTPESAKRVFGAIGFIASIIMIWMYDHTLIQYLLTLCVAMLGLESVLGMIEKVLSIGKKK